MFKSLKILKETKDFGAMSGAVIYLREDLTISELKVDIVLGVFNFCSLFGSIAGGRICDWIGRRYTIALAGVLFLAGAILMACASGYGFLSVGNLACSTGVGFAFMIAPVYTAEVAPASFRGFLATFPEVFMNVGLLVGYILAYAFSRLPLYLGWRLMLGAGGIPAICLIVGILAMPESPRWLVMQGRFAEAKRVLERTSDTKEEAHLRLVDIIEAAGQTANAAAAQSAIVKPLKSNTSAADPWKELFLRPTPAICHILIAALGINFFRQASGLDVTLLYGPTIFEKAGVAPDQKLLATIGLGAVKLIFVLFATFLLDRSGRRPLLLISAVGMIFSLFGLATGLIIIDQFPGKKVTWAIALCVTAILCNTAFFSIGLGPITWVYTSEIFPLQLRGVGASIAIAVNRLTSGIIVLSFTSLSKVITIGRTFLMYAGISMVAWLFFYSILPETKGKTLEEMQGLFGEFFIWRSRSSSSSSSSFEKEKKQVDQDHS
ncbi:Sugar/inositol transporter [Parasponia andersonii]|uniref:Sugar/inositol transporter n=1 Tax=Parasponia andersonii TaxID=3476 RepID=A0A2P5DU90_PARAD|nr:Sugar/inositol transporter [Parasponia andersonii]